MFSENEKISGRQLYRTIVVTLVGPTLLLGPRIVAKFGADGFLVYGLAGIFSVIYVALMMFIRQCVFEKKGFANGLICSSKCMAGKALLNVLLSALEIKPIKPDTFSTPKISSDSSKTSPSLV